MTLPPAHVFAREEDRIQEAEEAAAACLEHCRSMLRITSQPIPVPVETLVESPLGFDLEVAALKPVRGFRILGRAYLRQQRMVIDEAVAASDERFRFTVAHELGHLRLHASLADEWVEQAESADDPDWRFRRSNPFERQADRFAAAFLMPPAEVVRAIFTICEARGLPSRETIVELLSGTHRSTELWRRDFVPGLARAFLVSPAAVVFRLSGLRFRDHAPVMLTRHAVQFLESTA